MCKKILCILFAVSIIIVPAWAAESAPAYTFGGWNETVWAEFPQLKASEVISVSYSGPVSGSLTGQDFAYLVRDTEKGLRVDILGLSAGAYEVTVATEYRNYVFSVEVPPQDRSGYAHFQYMEGVGAYNDDGTLKENAIVLYVTEENKDTVTLTSADGTTVTGIGHILNSRGRSSSGGSLTNNNQDILRKLAADGTPLVVRIVGRVTLPQGLTAHNSKDYGGSIGDNGGMAKMQGGKDITIEGIGVDACIDGWGLHFICGGGDYARGWGKSFEVRNLTFCNVPEDCVGMEGEQDGSELSAPVERCWIHHCAFYGPTISNPAESDKAGGDGACDFKRGQYFTNAYCYYEGYHKTNLVGGSDSNLQYHMTYHHNYWKNCESRAPLARQANIHMYNNIFEGQTSYCVNPRANAYIFSEYNLFLNCKNPVRVKLGGVKSYADSFEGCRGDNHATIVADKAAQVETDCKYANFDTDGSLSYIPSGNYLLQESIELMQSAVLTQAGPQRRVAEDSHIHSYTSSVATQPGCETAGVLIYTCECGQGYTEQLPAAGHELMATENAPTCTEDALVEISCIKCGMKDQEILPATGHSYQNGDCIFCGEQDPNAPPQTQPLPSATELAAPTQPEEIPPATTVPDKAEPQPISNGGAGKTALTVVLATVAAGFTVATVLEWKKKR